MKKLYCFMVLALLAVFTHAQAEISIPMKGVMAHNINMYVGSIRLQDTPYGLLITPHLHSLPPGPHGFHIHETPDCSNGGLNAGGHYDPHKTLKHLGPYDPNGHLGDLPALVVNSDQFATIPLLAPKLRMEDVKGRAVIIHEGSDNYSDDPKKLGGGGKRIACGVVH